MCSNPECKYNISDTFKFVNKRRRTTNATDMLIVSAYRNLMEAAVSIANRFHISATYAHEVFDHYVKMVRLPLTDTVCIDKIFLAMDEHCKYALVIQDFHIGDPIDLLRRHRKNATEPYFTNLAIEEKKVLNISFPICITNTLTTWINIFLMLLEEKLSYEEQRPVSLPQSDEIKKLKNFRDLKETYIQFNARNAGKPIETRKELDMK